MHPSFGCEYIVARSSANSQVAIHKVGWGYFDIPMTIFWSKNLNLQNVIIDH